MKRMLVVGALGALGWLLGLVAFVGALAPHTAGGAWPGSVAFPAAASLALGGAALLYGVILAVRLRVLRGWLAICAGCKRIRDAEGGWVRLESFVEEHSHAEFTHGLCDRCVHALRERTGAA
jgi:hypothetical protein